MAKCVSRSDVTGNPHCLRETARFGVGEFDTFDEDTYEILAKELANRMQQKAIEPE